ncbi:MAG TPA: S-adenosylmethionine:tRNA ribosyltransferase-isomerase, partial [Rectinemataceae bacterium]|nr:S-adenosylmethionine:tRNA ribosyltransferase-isomerase [Rectinemataceae bacterium]
MRTDDFNFDLPESSIAQYPTNERGTSRLFVLDRQRPGHVDSKVSE